MLKKQYRFGISTTVDYSEEIETLFHLFSKHKYDFISIGADSRHNYYPDKNKLSNLINMADGYNLQIESAHAPFGGDYDLAHSSSIKRQKAVDNTLDFMNYLSHNDIPMVIIHPHHFLKVTKENAFQLAAESIKTIVCNKPANIKIAVENLPDKRGSWIADQLLSMFGQSDFGFCYDSSHENMSGEPFHLLKKHYSRLITCHLSDNNGSSDEHLVPGDGNIDWSRTSFYLNKAESFRNILFEVGTGEKLSVPVEDYIKRTALKAAEIFG